MTLPTILLALRPFFAVLVALPLIPWISRCPLGKFTGFLRDSHSLLRATEENKKLGPTERPMLDMTKLFLPVVNRDFPALDWSEERIAIEKYLALVLTAGQALDLSKLVPPFESLRERICLAIEDDRMNGLTRSFSGIAIHKTTIADHKNLPILTEIRIVSSVGFLASLAGESIKKSKDEARAAALAVPYRVETSVTLVFVHAQSVNVENGYQKIVGISCPHCGVPPQRADARTCPFCKSALAQADSMAWLFEEIEFQTLI